MISFSDADELQRRIDGYFEHIDGEFHFEDTPSKTKNDKEVTEQRKVWDRLPQPPTISGLALYLGFESSEELDEYIKIGPHASLIKRARLRIETAYEQKLHNGPASGAIFALKKLGWNQPRSDNITDPNDKNMKVIMEPSGVNIAEDERDVDLS